MEQHIYGAITIWESIERGDFMRNLKKSLLALCAVVVVAGLLTSFILMYHKRYDEGLVLQDEPGDRSHLNDVEFYGILADDIQQTAFRFTGDKWNKKFSLVTDEGSREIYNYSQGYIDSSLYPSTICSIDMTDVVPNPNPDHWEEGQQGNRSESYTGKGIITYSTNNRQFSSDVIWSGNMTKGLSGVVSRDNGEYWDYSPFSRKGYIWKDDKLYLYTLTDSNCSGYGGVYDITKIFNSNAVALGPGEIKIDLPNIAPLDLEDGKVQIVDMVMTERRLIYLFVRDGLLYIRPFNLQINDFENEIELGQIPKNAQAQNEYVYSAENGKLRGGFTEMFSQGNIICVAAFSNATSGLYAGNYFGGLRCAFYAVDIENGALLQSYLEEPLDDAKISIKNIDMIYKNDVLYVLRKYGVFTFEGSGAYIPESRLKISAYKNSRSVYQGNIISGAQEDYKYQFQDQKLGTRTYMRDYYFIGIK